MHIEVTEDRRSLGGLIDGIKHTPFDGTPEQRANLEKLAAYVEQLPADYPYFDMRTFGVDRYQDGDVCGTVACFIGHGPAAGVQKWHERGGFMGWGEYLDVRFTGNIAQQDWISSTVWAYSGGGRASSPAHAAARARYLLDRGLPHNWNAQAHGQSPLSYLEYVKEPAHAPA